jgi:hypothetical protein
MDKKRLVLRASFLCKENLMSNMGRIALLKKDTFLLPERAAKARFKE